ncbi:hypothetical protein Pcinc_030100 [Petrolisthes cinctipes]|uniref:Uncharacterized protein n=1 Tax=Petrolisthes cinctipes TaxID=88211 RepID=A0AAE1EZF2_PETCI|nr:hypothetical protein Pcinc_030100 [Petrolisthes cinctipes]
MGQTLEKVYYQPQVNFVVWLGRQHILNMWARLQTKCPCYRQQHHQRHSPYSSRPSSPSRPPSPHYTSLKKATTTTTTTTSPPRIVRGGAVTDTLTSEVHLYDCPHNGSRQMPICPLW